MKILITTDAVGGIWNYSLQIIELLKKEKVEFIVANIGPVPSANQIKQISKLPNVKFLQGVEKLEWMTDSWKEVESAGKWLLQLENKYHPDVIHLNHYSFGNLKFHAPVLAVIHSCVFSWWRTVKKCDPPQEYFKYYDHVRRGLSAADLLVAPTHTMLQQAKHLYGNFKSEAVILNGRNPEVFFPAIKDDIVVCAGRGWDEGKNIKVVIQAAKDFEWPLVFAGESSSLKIQKPVNVIFKGIISSSRIAAMLSRSSIYVHPALYEPFGLSVLEAALACNALILSDIETMHELWEDAAIFVDPADPGKWAESVNDLIRDEQKRKKLSHKAYLQALKYNAAFTAQNYLRVYKYLKFSNHDILKVA